MLEDLIERVNEMVEELLEGSEKKSAEELGLEIRATSYQKVFVSSDFIAVPKSHDTNLQYYGGFEYVSKEYRKEIGDYVFYMVEDSRVARHLSQAGMIDFEEEFDEMD